MQSLYELTKKIDALTANSMQVLNALVRSCIAGGSSRGYTVSKYGVTIEMSRADIYRLYDFYQDWERHGFTVDGFDALLEKANQRWVNSKQGASGDANSTLATDAVVKHSQILYLDSTNSKNTSPDFWVDKIKETAAKSEDVAKATVSSAPIPLNLRTPLYDENLSVKSFTQYETYLFPMGYQRTLILGVPGNGESYLAGGKNWTIEVTDYLSLRGKHTVFGTVTNPQNRVDNYFYVSSNGIVGDESVNTISGGKESYALADNSGAFGLYSYSIGKNAYAFGDSSRAYGDNSFIAGGQNCVTLGDISFATGMNTLTVNDTAFAANRGTTTTPTEYLFSIESIENSQDVATTECTSIFDESRSECIVPDSAAAVAAMSAARTIVIDDARVTAAGNTELGIQVGDEVMIYDHRRLSGGNYINAENYGGYAFRTMMTTVTGITRDEAGKRYLVELNKPVQLSATVNGNLYGTVVRGKIAVVSRKVSARDANGTYTSPAVVRLGTDCTAFGYATKAAGMAQTVVGAHNAVNYYARFIVGCGSAYIKAGNLYDGIDEDIRSNAMVVSPFYSYMRELNGTGTVGVGSSGYYGDDSDGVQIFRGGFMTGDDGKGLSTVVNATPEKVISYARVETESHGMLLLGTTGKPVVGNSWPATTHLFSRHGMAIVSAGAYISENTPLVETLLEESKVLTSTDEGVGVYSKGGIEIRSIGKNGMHIGASAYISMKFAGLTMSGETYRTLAASDKSRDHVLSYTPGEPAIHRSGLEELGALCHSGFYYGWMGRKNLSFNQSETWQTFDAWHVISSAAEVDSTTTDVSALLLPAEVKGTYYPRPRVVNFRNDGSYQATSVRTMNEALAFYRDCLFSSGTIKSANTATIEISGNGIATSIEASGDMVVDTDNRSNADASMVSAFASGTLSLRNVVYTLNGNCLSMSMKLTSNMHVISVTPIVQFRYRCTIPLFLGLNVVPQRDYRFPSVPLTRDISYTHIPLTTEFDFMGEEDRDVIGYAAVWSNGMVSINITNLYSKPDTDDVMYLSFTGPVPFYAAEDSLGMNIDPDTRVD